MDNIDRKLEQDKLRRSVVKYWNVNYSVEQIKIGIQTPEDASKADAGKTKSEKKSGRDMSYNPYTNSCSGEYGKQPVEAEQAEVIGSILDEKKFDLDKILKDTDVSEEKEIQQEAVQGSGEEAVNAMTQEDLAAQAVQRVQSSDASAKAAAAVEEAMAASRAAAEVVAAADVSARAATAVEEAKSVSDTPQEI